MIIEQVYQCVYRSAQPSCKKDFEQIIKIGITSVIDLENEYGESPWECDKFSKFTKQVTFNSCPMSGFFSQQN